MSDTSTTNMTLDVSSGVDCIVIGGVVRVELVKKSGSTARLRVVAPREVVIKKELMQDCQFRGKHAPITSS
jgi:sRNA-binding carbon storage regulator CsrA